MFNPIKWLLTKSEPAIKEITVSGQLNDTSSTVAPATTTESTPAADSMSPVEEAKAGVKDFEAALAFVENGVAQLGEAAKDELKSLAVKYL